MHGPSVHAPYQVLTCLDLNCLANLNPVMKPIKLTHSAHVNRILFFLGA